MRGDSFGVSPLFSFHPNHKTHDTTRKHNNTHDHFRKLSAPLVFSSLTSQLVTTKMETLQTLIELGAIAFLAVTAFILWE